MTRYCSFNYFSLGDIFVNYQSFNLTISHCVLIKSNHPNRCIPVKGLGHIFKIILSSIQHFWVAVYLLHIQTRSVNHFFFSTCHIFLNHTTSLKLSYKAKHWYEEDGNCGCWTTHEWGQLSRYLVKYPNTSKQHLVGMIAVS